MRCHDCGVERDGLHKHHIVPKSLGGSNDSSNLVKLCANCHEDRHKGPVGGELRGKNSHSPAAQAKKSAVMKAHWQDPAFRAKGVKALQDPNKRARTAVAMRAVWQDPEYRAHNLAAAAAATTPEVIARRGESIRKRWAEDPEYRARNTAHLREIAKRPRQPWSEERRLNTIAARKANKVKPME
jgi:hypothetical protein